MLVQVLLWHGVTALYHANGRHEANHQRNKHHHISVSEHTGSIIVDPDNLALVSNVISER